MLFIPTYAEIADNLGRVIYCKQLLLFFNIKNLQDVQFHNEPLELILFHWWSRM